MTLSCDDEPRALVLLAVVGDEEPGFARVGWELAPGCGVDASHRLLPAGSRSSSAKSRLT